MELKSVIFDMDGVITDTAQIHFKAWKQIFDDYLQEDAKKRGIAFEPFTLDDYIRYVDGLSRIDGVKYFLQSRSIISSSETLDRKEEDLIQKIASVKNKVFLKLIATDGVTVFPGTIDLIKELKKHNIKTAVISSSKNCKDILKQADVINLFDAIVDGKALKQFHLKGKPEPDIFLEAAKRIEVDPSETIVVEDALSGIIAGKAGQFGLVIGIDRQNKWNTQFKQKGADIVVSDLSELRLSEIREQLTRFCPLASTAIETIKKQIKNKKVILFCDYDGTLTPIVRRPELAVLSNDMKDILFQLKEHCLVVIISGRELANLENMVAINGLFYAGNHGFEIIGPDHFITKFEIGTDFLDDVKHAYADLSVALASFENCLIENKKLSLSVHYRMVAEHSVIEIEKIVDAISKRYPKLKKHHGKKVFELRPNIPWNKGKAVKFILSEIAHDSDNIFPIYIGDDVTDEDAFAALKKEGLSIIVSEIPKETRADYRLHNPNEVYHFLKDLMGTLATSKFEIDESKWTLSYKDFEPERERLREALCTLGNGYFATRGASDESHADDVHYPGTYFAGVYNRLKSIISGKEVYNEDLVNMPNWLPLTFKIDNKWFSLADVTILEYAQELNMQKGILLRKLRIKDNKGRITRLEYKRFVSMSNPHLAGQRFTLQAENWSGHITIQSGFDGSVINSGVARYRDLNAKHLQPLKVKSYKDGRISLVMRSNQSHIEVAYTAWHHFYHHNKVTSKADNIVKDIESIYCHFNCYIDQNQSLRLEKLVTVATNKDRASSDCLTDTKNLMKFIKRESFDALLRAHSLIWRNLWRLCDFKVDSEGEDQRILRLHIFHLLQTVSRNSIDLDIGVPARGLHGESYRGHIFWDELFIMPFYIFYFPEMARSLLLYRYRRLNMARYLAAKSGFKGAMYPWQSGSNGDEVTQPVHLNPRSNEWLPDYSHYQRHVNAAIVYNIWKYYLATNDKNFMSDYGIEMVCEIARFWSSISVYNSVSGRYEINNIVGPDEYHEKYPGSDQPGVNNNAYTNFMAVWSIERALELLENFNPIRCQELREQLQIDDDELGRWRDITTKMTIPFHDTDIISQFSGYENLAEFNWTYYETKHGNIERLDRILKAENDSPDNYQVSKQADVLMLFYLFSFDELTAAFEKLGYLLNKETLIKNITYYLKRTSHGSTLSKVVLASLSKYIDQDIVLKFYQDVLNSDIMDTQGGTTPEGIHLGAMASCLNINLMCFAGLEIKNNTLSFSPNLPKRIRKLQFNLQFRQQWLEVIIHQDNIKVRLRGDSEQPLPILLNGRMEVLEPL